MLIKNESKKYLEFQTNNNYNNKIIILPIYKYVPSNYIRQLYIYIYIGI